MSEDGSGDDDSQVSDSQLLQEWRERYEGLERDLLKLQEGRHVVRHDTTLSSTQQTATYDVETSTSLTVVTYNTSTKDLEETREVVESDVDSINQLLRQQVQLLAQANRSLGRKVDRLTRSLTARDHTHDRFRTFVATEKRIVADLSGLVTAFKRDYGRLRTTVGLFLSQYHNELVEQRVNLSAQMAEAGSLSSITGIADPTAVEATSGDFLEEIVELKTDESSSDLIEVPKIMVHSGSMTEAQLEDSGVLRLTHEVSSHENELFSLYKAFERVLEVISFPANQQLVHRLRSLLTSHGSIEDVVALVNETLQSVPRSRPPSRSRSPIDPDDDELPVEAIIHKLQYEARIRELEQEIVSIASEKQRLANELNRATQSSSHFATQMSQDRSTKSVTYEQTSSAVKESTSLRHEESCRLQDDSHIREDVLLEVAAAAGASGTGPRPDDSGTQDAAAKAEAFHIPLSEASSLSEDSASRWCSEIQGLREHINALQRQLDTQKELSERLLREKSRMLEQVAELRDEKRRLEDTAIHRSREQQRHIESLSMRCEQLQDGREVERKERVDGQIIGTLKAELEKLSVEVRQLSEENLHLKNQTISTRHDWQSIVQKQSSEARRLELEKLQLQEQIEESRADGSAVRREVDHLQSRLLQLTKELTASKEDSQRERGKAEAARQSSAQLEKEIDKIRLFYEDQAQDLRTNHQKTINELKSGYETQIGELRARFKTTADEYNSRLKHEMFPVLDEFQRLNVTVAEAEAEVASLRGLLEQEKAESERNRESERSLREQIATLTSDLSESRAKCEELLGQLDELHASQSAQLATLENMQRAAVALKSECDRQRRLAERSAAERAELERELMTLREARNQSDTTIQSECSHMQEKIVVLLRERESLSTELATARSDEEVLRGRVTLLEMQLEERRKKAAEEEDSRDRESQRMSELKEQLNSARIELDIYRERMTKLEWQRTELLECRERLRRLDSALLPLTQQAPCAPEAVEEAVVRFTNELEDLRGRLGSTEHQLTNVRSLSLSESLRNFEDSKKATELQRELTVKDARINALEQRLLRLQTEIELEKQCGETRITEGLPLQRHNKVLMHAELSKASTSLKLMEQKHEGEMENERRANQRLREQMDQLRADCENLRRALQKTQGEVEGLRRSRAVSRVERESPVRSTSIEKHSNSRALVVGCSHSVGGGRHDIKEHSTKEKNYEQLYRRLKHDYNNLRQKLETLRRLQKDAAAQEFTANNVLLNELSRSLHNVSADPSRMPEETQALCVTVEAYQAPRHQDSSSEQTPTQQEPSTTSGTRALQKSRHKMLEFGDMP